MQIYEALELDIKHRETLSFVGGGGKTTTIFQLGEELKRLNKKVLITTTTAMYKPKRWEYDYFFLGYIAQNFIPNNGTITILGKRIRENKLVSPYLLELEYVANRKIFDFILIEGDGAKGRAIKAPANHEPVISKYTTKTIGIIGIDCLYKKIDEVVHRPEIFTKLVDKNYLDTVDEQSVARLVLNNRGLFKESIGQNILLLNKVNNERRLLGARNIEKVLWGEGFKGRVVIADIKKKIFY